MEVVLKFIYFISASIIFWAMIGYSLSLKVISKLLKNRNLKKNYSYQPTVTVMVAAHNEEKVIKDKLDNIIRLNYPKNKIEFLVSSDNSTDKTNEIVKEFIKSHPIEKISLYEVKERKGKTNAQNEAQKMVKSEILVMTDANSIMDENAIIELVAAFADEDVSYVSGRLIIVNKEVSGIKIEYRNLGKNLVVHAVSQADTEIAVILKGSERVINEFDTEAIHAYVDLGNYTVGEHEVDVVVYGDDVRITYVPKVKRIRVKIVNQ